MIEADLVNVVTCVNLVLVTQQTADLVIAVAIEIRAIVMMRIAGLVGVVLIHLSVVVVLHLKARATGPGLVTLDKLGVINSQTGSPISLQTGKERLANLHTGSMDLRCGRLLSIQTGSTTSLQTGKLGSLLTGRLGRLLTGRLQIGRLRSLL